MNQPDPTQLLDPDHSPSEPQKKSLISRKKKAAALDAQTSKTNTPKDTKKFRRGQKKVKRNVPEEGFDFLGGKFAQSTHTRVLNLVTLAVGVAVVGTLAASSLTSRVAVTTVRSATKTVEAEIAAANEELNVSAVSGAATFTQVDEHIKERAGILSDATNGEIDWPLMINGVKNLGTGITVTSVSFSGPGFEEVAVAGGPTETTGATGATGNTNPAATNGEPSDGGTEFTESAGDGYGVIELTGTLDSQARALELETLLADNLRFPWMSGGIPDIFCGSSGSQESSPSSPVPPSQGSPAACTWTWTGQLNEQSRSVRATELPKTIGAKLDEGDGN